MWESTWSVLNVLCHMVMHGIRLLRVYFWRPDPVLFWVENSALAGCVLFKCSQLPYNLWHFPTDIIHISLSNLISRKWHSPCETDMCDEIWNTNATLKVREMILQLFFYVFLFQWTRTVCRKWKNKGNFFSTSQHELTRSSNMHSIAYRCFTLLFST